MEADVKMCFPQSCDFAKTIRSTAPKITSVSSLHNMEVIWKPHHCTAGDFENLIYAIAILLPREKLLYVYSLLCMSQMNDIICIKCMRNPRCAKRSSWIALVAFFVQLKNRMYTYIAIGWQRKIGWKSTIEWDWSEGEMTSISTSFHRFSGLYFL